MSEKNLGDDLTSLDRASGELRLIEVKGIGAAAGAILLTPNAHRVAQDRRDCYWPYVVTNCGGEAPKPVDIRDPAQLPWGEVVKVQHYAIRVRDIGGAQA